MLFHILPPLHNMYARMPLTPEEDPRQKSALKVKKKREEAANLDKRSTRGGHLIS